MKETAEVWKKLLALCDQAVEEVEKGFIEMPGVIQETCSGNGYRHCGSSARKSTSPSTKSSQTTVSLGPTVNMSESVVSQRSISEKSSISNFDGKLQSVVFSSMDKKQLIYAHFFDSEKPIEDEEMRKLEKELGC